VKLCVVIPTYDNPETIAAVVRGAQTWVPDVVVVDDGSAEAGRAAVDALRDMPGMHVLRREKNGGKGAAVKDGLRLAHELGFSHALQVDADGQHLLEDIPRFVEAARECPEALVLGEPKFDASVPKGRLHGRKITTFFTRVEMRGRRTIHDPMCGFRVYPLDEALLAKARGNAMDFDIEIAVRMAWRGVPIVNLPTQVRYVGATEGGVSHFRMVRDNWLISCMHVRLVLGAILRLFLPSRRKGWLDVAEAGSIWGIKIFAWAATIFGRGPARLILRIVVLYYVLARPSARRASRLWLGRLLGPTEKVSLGDVYSHLLAFAEVTVDRLFMARREFARFEITCHGKHYLKELAAQKRGAILLGAHLGSFEALRMQGEADEIPINVIVYFRNSRLINSVLEALNPATKVRLIQIDPDRVEFIFKLKECIERGELVAILGDRVGLGGPTVEVDFLGERARLPGGAYVLAATLACPIYLTFGIYKKPNRYDLYCEPFAERVILPRHERRAAIASYAQAYARRLEHFGRLAPDNWFNFFDFWAKPGLEGAQ
jgi:predicted LPLAT superfamily acyltransferase